MFLFGSHLVYAEIAALVGLLTARLPLREDGRTGRFLVAVVPVVLAGALVCAIGGIVARAWDTRTAEAAFRNSASAGVYDVEREPGGRPFRWTGESAAWPIERPSLPPGSDSIVLALPVRNGRPDGRPAALDVFFDDTLRGRVTLPPGAWRRLELTVSPGARGVLRIRAVDPFRPAVAARPPSSRHPDRVRPHRAPGRAMSLLRVHPGDPGKKSRSLEIGPLGGAALAGFLLGCGASVVLGLAGAPHVVSDAVNAADRRAIEETAQRGAESFASVGRRALALGNRLAADELFLARVGAILEIPLPDRISGGTPERPFHGIPRRWSRRPRTSPGAPASSSCSGAASRRCRALFPPASTWFPYPPGLPSSLLHPCRSSCSAGTRPRSRGETSSARA